MAKIISAAEAAELINDGDSIVFAADGLVCFPNELVDAVEQRYLKEKHPAGITSIRAAGMGNWGDAGEAHWCHDGMITRAINSYMSVCPPLCKRVEDNKIEGYMFPLGPIMQLFHEIGRGMPGMLSKIGLGTFMDARNGGGKLNQLTAEQGEDFVKYIPDFEGEDYLWYTLPKLNVALLRASSADPHGNISIDKEAEEIEVLSVAQAVKSSGGIVICQVDELVELHTVNPHMIKVPGIYIDYIVVAQDRDAIPQNMARTKGATYEPAFTGEVLKEVKTQAATVPLNERKVIARRAALELRPGYNVNMGLGMPTTVPMVLAEAGVDDRITMISETGTIGGVPGTERLDFGCHWNPEAFSDHGEHFSYFDGGNLDCGVFGLSEVDADGNMNTSHLNGRITGVGGFTDISSNAKKVLFIGTFTAVGLKTEIGNGTIKIVNEGKYKKFIKKCDKVSFVASEYLRTHDSFLYITERCVIRRTKDGMILEEVAPGIDIQTQILDLCDAELTIPEGGPRIMDERLFREEPLMLGW